MRRRLQDLVEQAGPAARRGYLQGAFAQEAEELLTALHRLAWGSPSADTSTRRAEQMLYACGERLAYLRSIESGASEGYVAYTARSLARDLDIAFYLLSPQAVAV